MTTKNIDKNSSSFVANLTETRLREYQNAADNPQLSIWSRDVMLALVLRIPRHTCAVCNSVNKNEGHLVVLIKSIYNNEETISFLPLEKAILRYEKAFKCSREEVLNIHFPKLPRKIQYLDFETPRCNHCWKEEEKSYTSLGFPASGPLIKHPHVLPAEVALNKAASMISPNAKLCDPRAAPHAKKTNAKRLKPREERGVRRATDAELF